QHCVGQKGEEWGGVENGLQMSVSPAHESRESSAAFQFRVEIRNVGEKDLLLLLGEMLANGKKQSPSAVRVLLTNPQGENLDCGVPGDGMIAGWVGPFIVPLPVGASYSLPIDLKNWTANWRWCYPPQDIRRMLVPFTLTAGKYVLRAQYSANAEKGNYWPTPREPPPRYQQPPDQILWAGIILMPKWIGTVTSNQVEFQWPPLSPA